MKKIILAFLLFPLVSMAAEHTVLGDPSGNDNPGYNGKYSLNLNSAGQITTTLQKGENETLNKMDVNAAGSYKQVTATGAIKASAGALVGFWLASTTACTVQLHDDPDSATAPVVLNTTAALTVLGWYPLPVTFTTGLYFTEGGACDITFAYH